MHNAFSLNTDTVAMPQSLTISPLLQDALDLLQSGERDAARSRLLALWRDRDPLADPETACAVAHFLADLEQDPAIELGWDLAALEIATGGQAGEDRPPRTAALSDWMMSLHLNVGDAFLRNGDHAMARRHAEIGLAYAVDGSAGYFATIRQGLERLLRRASVKNP